LNGGPRRLAYTPPEFRSGIAQDILNRSYLALLVALGFAATAAANAAPLRNIVLVHGAWVDASGWKSISDILVRKGFHVTMVQEPETSFADDVRATKRVLDLQDGPTLLVGHSYGGSVITEAGVHPNVVGLVYVAAHAPDVGENESALCAHRYGGNVAREPRWPGSMAISESPARVTSAASSMSPEMLQAGTDTVM
jgi:pimeloyl-ACP methyl ester carboxylesterase